MKPTFTPSNGLLPFYITKWCGIFSLAVVISLQAYTHRYHANTSGSQPNKARTHTNRLLAFVGEQLTSFTLINADTDQPIQTLTNGAILNLTTLPTKNLNIRANTSPADVGSVILVLTGTQSVNKTENGAPYTLFGNSGSNYFAWVPAAGSYTLKGTPYSSTNGGGTAGTSLTVNFSVVNQTSTTLISNIQATSGNPYTLSQLAVGTTVYTDRTYQITSVPTDLSKMPFIKTPNDDKKLTTTTALSFNLSQSATVYVGYDPMATALPAWLSGWQKLTSRVGIQDPRIDYLTLYSKAFPAGKVSLGGNLASPAAGSKNTYMVIAKPGSDLRPYVTAVRPANGATNVSLDQSVSVDLRYPGGNSIDGNTVNTSTVKLYRVASDGTKTLITGTAVNSTAAGDAITLSAALRTGTKYEFSITNLVKDDQGNAMIPFTSRFTTTSSTPDTPTDLSGISFTEQTLIDNTFGTDGFTTLVIGPDRRLYAATSGGKIERWDLRTDGTITNRVTISPFGTTRRLLIGFHFDPAATSTNLIAWVSHSSGIFTNAPDWAGKISRLNLNDPAVPKVTDYVINLPRSYKDHSTNSIDFGPDGALYFTQGSNTAMGAADPAWGNRDERLLSGSVLRLDITKAQQQTLPINAKTSDGGTYNPYASTAALTFYATGVRNAYDLVWHSNGQLYIPTNGSAAGGSTPALASGTTLANGQTYTGPDIPAMTDVRDSQNDYLFRVVKGGYYGHPNVLRREYILNGANPTSGVDPGEVVWTTDGVTMGYKVGTLTDPNYRGFAYDFGLNKSPNGVIEYKSNAFGGKLKGKMLVCRFSGGDDIMVLQPGGTNLNIIAATEGIKVPGLRRPFSNPLDVIEDVRTGNLYLSEYYDGNGNGQPRITLLKADQPATATLQRTASVFDKTIDTENETEGLKLRVYPNPSNAGAGMYVEVKNFGPQQSVTLTLHDLTGRTIPLKKIVTDEQGSGTTPLPDALQLKRGLYMVRATGRAGKQEAKLMIK